MKRLLGGVALAAAVALGVRTYRKKRRAIATVPIELRHPILYVPFPLTSRTLARAARRLPVRPSPVTPGVTVDRHQDPVPMYVYQPAARSIPSGALLYIHVTDDTDSIPAAWIDTGGFPFDGTGANNTIQWNALGIVQLTG